MNKLASVIYAYSPKNDDELELAVGDRIEVIGYEEEGWWKGKLKGRIGVFPSNFVEVVDSVTSSTQQQQQQQQQQVTNKLNSIFSSKVTSKNSISSNSLNTLNNNSGTNSLNNNNSTSNNNLIMNNTQNEIDSTNNEYPFATTEESLNSSASSNEKRPKPIRGNGFGDIFAAGAKLKPLPADPSKPAMASERLSTITNNLTSTLQKPIPKKPPPPAPANDTNSNGSLSDQAPALPPKPSNQFSPFLQQQQTSSRPLPPATHSQTSIAQVREQVRVIYAYKSLNPDELTIEVGDIINVIDKNIEDAGWWKGELNGKIGVFPDNFVKPIADTLINNSSQPDWNSSGSRTSSVGHQSSLGFNQQQFQTTTTTAATAATATNPENKVKSVFAATPKGFSKELENNLERHGNPALFLSLKRNKLQQQQANSGSLGLDDIAQTKISEMNIKREPETGGSQETSPTKLNHITANRAKGPSRRPPSSILNKRNQLSNDFKRETNGRVDETAPCSLPANPNSQQQPTNHDTLSSLPFGPNKGGSIAGGIASLAHDAAITAPQIKSNLSLNPDGETQQQVAGPKPPTNNNPRYNPTPASQVPDKIITAAPVTNNTTTTTSSPPTRPPWMVELRKSNLEKKRDTTALNHDDDAQTPITSAANSKPVDPVPTPTINNPLPSEPLKAASPERKNLTQSPKENHNPLVNTVKSISSRYTTGGDLSNPTNQQPINSDTPSRASLLSSNNHLLPTQDSFSVQQQQDISHSPVTNRLNNLFGKGPSPPSKNITPLSTSNTNENGTRINNHNVPSNDNKYLGNPSNSTTTTTSSTNQISSIDTNNHPVTATPATTGAQRSPQSVVGKIGTNAADRQSVTDSNETKFVMSKSQYDNLLKQISNNVNAEISELKNEVKKLQEEFKDVRELKAVIESMKTELTACQSATENQKRYIRELVNNLADERKKIAAMQGEIEKNFK